MGLLGGGEGLRGHVEKGSGNTKLGAQMGRAGRPEVGKGSARETDMSGADSRRWSVALGAGHGGQALCLSQSEGSAFRHTWLIV